MSFLFLSDITACDLWETFQLSLVGIVATEKGIVFMFLEDTSAKSMSLEIFILVNLLALNLAAFLAWQVIYMGFLVMYKLYINL